MSFNRTSGNTSNSDSIGNILNHGGPRSYGHVTTYLDQLLDGGADADPAPAADYHSPGHVGVGGHMHTGIKMTVVTNRSSGVHDAAFT